MYTVQAIHHRGFEYFARGLVDYVDVIHSKGPNAHAGGGWSSRRIDSHV